MFIGCHLTEANLRSYPGLTDDWLAVLATSAPNLSSVNLSGCAALTPDGFNARVRRARVAGCERVPGRQRRRPRDGGVLSRLRRLACAGCDGITGAGLRYVSGATKLRVHVNPSGATAWRTGWCTSAV